MVCSNLVIIILTCLSSSQAHELADMCKPELVGKGITTKVTGE
jgi:hypothetical protein